MAGTAVDGEDIVQDALMKALAALPNAGVLDNPEGWLFRIAHNTALDFLRRRARGPTMLNDEALDMIAAPGSSNQNHEITATSLRTFMRLPTLQRSAVILKDVLGHSLEEVASITGASEAAAKSALQRGRARLREIAREPADISLPVLSDAMRARLIMYVEGFKTGDFDAVRAMLADDVKLDLVATLRKQGKREVGEYYSAYAAAKRWAYAASMRGATGWSSARGRGCSSSSGSATRSGRATRSTAVDRRRSGSRTTSTAACSPRAPRGSSAPCAPPTTEPGWDPRDVDLIECHATGTPVGDAVEFAEPPRALGRRAGWPPGRCVIGSVKSNIGHALTAAGRGRAAQGAARPAASDPAPDRQLRRAGAGPRTTTAARSAS